MFDGQVIGSRESRTAQGAAFCRLVEQQQPSELRQFDDPVVGRLLDPLMAAMAAAVPLQDQVLGSLAPGTYGGLVMRTRYIDDVVTAWAETGVTQLVVLGAGLDTRAYRLASLEKVIVFEVDLPGRQRHKQVALRAVRRRAAEVRFVSVDLNTEPLEQALGAAGFDHGSPALFVWEGVTQYLTETGVRSTLTFVAGCEPGTALVFSYILRSSLGRHGYQGWSPDVKQQLGSTEPWLFGFDPSTLADVLDVVGLRLLDDVGDLEYQERYLQPIHRQVLVNSSERVALAVVPRATS